MGKKNDILQGTPRAIDSADPGVRARKCTGTPSPPTSMSCPTSCCAWEEGSLYPALHRMEQEGWIRAEWGMTEKNREAKFYSLTAAGRKNS